VWRNEITKVDHKTGLLLFPNLRPLNFFGGGALSTSNTMSEDLPTDSIRMQNKLDSFNPLDPRTGEIIVLSTFPTIAVRCLTTWIEIEGQSFPMKASRALLKEHGISDTEIKALRKALETGVVPDNVTPSWRTSIRPRTFGFTSLDEGHSVSGLRSQ
jgi:hypothetical protein